MKRMFTCTFRSSAIMFFVTVALMNFSGAKALLAQATYPGLIGVEVGDRPTAFTDALKDQGRLFQDSSGNPVPTDTNGFPTTDGILVVFDNRAIPAWAPPLDDPAEYQPDSSGTYKVAFQGQATLSSVPGNPTLTFANQVYNAAINTTTVDVTLPAGEPALMVISFTNTQRTPTSGTNTGITNLEFIRPNMPAEAYSQVFGQANLTANGQIFDPVFLNALAPFGYLRFMGWLGTNYQAGYYGDTGHHLIQWADRSLPTDLYQGVGTSLRAGAVGISWEYIIMLANAANKDVWINIPVGATGGSDPLDPTYDSSTNSYIYQLALLLKNGNAFTGNKGLNPGLHVYIEHSNEVWNWGFTQSTWNLLAAEDEVGQGNSVLNNDGNTNEYDWAYRRHAKRLYEIAQIFQQVFGEGSLNTVIRPVYAWWQLDEGPSSNAAKVLDWLNKTYGPPSNYFYAMAQGDYFSAPHYADDTTIPDVLADMQDDSDAGVTYVQQNLATAQQYGLPLFAYEGGPANDNGGNQDTTNVGVQILANRDSGMDTLVQHHIRDSWFQQGGSNFGYFSLSSAYSRYGDWGATDDYRNLTTAKYNALIGLMGYTSDGVPFSPGNLVATAGNQQVALSWSAVPGAASYNVKRGTAAGGSYSTVATTSSTTFADSNVINGMTYYYIVTAQNSAGESAPSNEASATPQALPPAAPANLIATAGDGQVTLTWPAVAGAATYNVYMGTSSGGESATPVATGITATAYTVPGLSNGTPYYFKVAAVNADGVGAYSNEAMATPVAPSTAVPIAVLNSSFELDQQADYIVPQGWTLTTSGESQTVQKVSSNADNSPAFTDVDGTYYWSPTIGNQGSEPYGSGTATLTSSSVGAFDANAVYTLTVALGDQGDYDPSYYQVGFQLLANGIPVANFVAPTSGDNALPPGCNWCSATGLADYSLSFNTASHPELAGQTITIALVYTYTGPWARAAYFDNVRLTETSEQAALVPPTGLTATGGNAMVTLSWNATAGATSYNVYQGTTSGGESSTPVATGITATSYTVRGLNNGSAYFFTVAAVGGGQVSAYSNEATATPVIQYGEPVAITVPNYSFEQDQQSSYITPQDWVSDSTNNGGAAVAPYIGNTPIPDITGTYYWSPNNCGQSDSPYGSETMILTSATPLGVFSPGTQYALTVALGAQNVSSDSQVGFQLLGNGVPVATFVAPTSGDNAIQSSNLADYALTFSTAVNPDVVGQNISIALVYTYNGQYCRNAYFDNVRLTQALETGAPAPSAPTGLTATAGSGAVTLAWDAVPGATSYNVYQGTTSGGEGTTPVATGITTNTHSAGNLTNGTTYYFVVAAVNDSGASAYSSEASATPSAAYGIPAAPMGLVATAGDSQITLSWVAVPGASSYNIYQGTVSGGEDAALVAAQVEGTAYSITGLTNGATYFFKITAVNSHGTSPLSNEASATPVTAVAGTNEPADFNIYSQVIAANPMPFGFNMAPAPGTSITENAWLADGAFSPYDERLSLTASQDGSGTTFIAANSGGTSYWSSLASGYFVGAIARTYRYSNGAWSLLRSDMVAGYTANSGSTAPEDNTITFAQSGPQTLAGDVIWLDLDNVGAVPNISQFDPRFTVYYPNWQTETQNGMQRNASAPWPYTLSTDVPASDAGGYSLQLTDTNTETNGIWQYVQGAFVGDAYEQFQPGHTYKVDVWLKQSGIASGNVTFKISGINVTHTFTGVTDSWQHFTWSFPAVPGLPAGSVQPSVHLDFDAPGTLWVNNFQLYDTAWAPNTLNPQVLQAWTDFHPGTIRIWSNFGNASGGYSFWSLDSWLEPEGRTRNTPAIGSQYEMTGQLQHLPTALANVKSAGANPWLIVNMALSEAEWGNLIDYLTAPAGVGYAARRPADHPGPYTDDFGTIYLEVGNEEWGTQSVPVNFAYGEWSHFVISQATANKDYFDPNKIKFIANGFFLNPSFGSNAAKAAPETSFVDYALYSSGDTSLSGDAYYQSDLLQLPATNKALIDAIVAQQQLDAASGRNYGLAAYEEGPGSDTPAHNGDTTLASAVGAIDVSLYASQSGFGPQNFFLYNLGTGPYTSHSNFANGFRPHPVWEALQMRNLYLHGPMVWVNANSVPTTNDGHAYPLIGVYAFHEENNQADVVVISRDLNNETPVTLHFPATPTGTAQLYTLTGDPRGGNDSAMNIPIGSQTVSVTADYTFNMPPGSMYIFQVPMTGPWSNVVAPPSAPETLTAVADNAKVALTWSPSQGATGYNIQRATVSGGPYTQIGTTSGTGYTDATVTNGTTYYYVVVAVDPGGVSANSPEAVATPNFENASFTTTAPPLDGTSGGSWESVQPVPLTHHFSGASPDTAWYKTLWDNNYLYVLVSVQDNSLVAPPQSDIWNGDAVEIYFSGTDSKGTSYGPSDFQYAFPYGDGGAAITEADHNAVSGVLLGQTAIDGGFQMAMALPWSTLKTTPTAGAQYGFEVMVDDATSSGNRLGKLAWWGTTDNTWSNPSLMGPLVLGAQASAPSSTTLTASPLSLPAGSVATLTATVAGEGATPTGSVVFSAGSATLCTAALDASGTATCSYTPGTFGNVTVAASYAGDVTHLASSASVVLNVYDGAITLRLASTQLVYLGATNVTACVTPSGTASATGAASIYDGSTLLTTQPLQGDGCAYWYIAPGLAAGAHHLTAAYSGDAHNPAGPSAATTVNVAPVPVNMSASCWNASFAYGANYQCTVNVSSNAGAAQGSITYSIDNSAAVAVPLSNGNAQFTIAKPAAGNHQVAISYAQQTNYAATEPQAKLFTVLPAPVNVALTPSTYYTKTGNSISFAAAVTSWSAGSPNATGSVSFYDGATLLANVPVDSTGKAVYSTASLTSGTHTVKATYAGGDNYASASGSATIRLVQ